MSRALLLILFLVVTASRALAVDISVDLEPKSGTTEDSFSLSVTIAGKAVGNASRPTFESSKQFTIDRVATSIGQHVVNGISTTTVTYTFKVYPAPDLAPGTYRLPTGSLTHENKRITLRSPEVTITASAAGAKDTNLGVDFVQVVDNLEPYIGEQVTYSAEIVSRGTIAQAVLDDVDFEGFYRETYGKAKESMRAVGTDGTKVYTVRDALFPTESGEVTIGPRGMTAQVQVPRRGRRRPNAWDPFAEAWPELRDLDSFYNRVEKRFVAPELQLTVRPLPPAPRPNLPYIPVGSVSLAASTDKKIIKAGEGLSYTVELYGDANLRPYELPAVESGDFKVYADKPEIQTFIENGRIKFRKRFTMALVPLREGTVPLPQFEIVTFDPSSEEYKFLRTPERTVSVLPGPSRQTQAPSPVAPSESPVHEPSGDALRAQHAGAALGYAQSRVAQKNIWFLLILPPLCAAVFILYGRRAAALLADPQLLARRNAMQRALLRIDSWQRSDGSPNALLAAVRSYIGDRFAIAPDGLTAAEIRDALQSELRDPQTLPLQAYELVSELERLIYAGPAHGAAKAASELATQTRELLMKIEGRS